MSNKQRYRIDAPRDHSDHLRAVLEQLAEEGRKIVSTIWQPTRDAMVPSGTDMQMVRINSGYVVISELD